MVTRTERNQMRGEGTSLAVQISMAWSGKDLERRLEAEEGASM